MGLTKAQALEVARCYSSIEYYADNYVFIQRADGLKMPIVMGKEEGEKYYYQRNILRLFEAGENILIFKSRRAGASWNAAVIASHLICFRLNVNILFVSRAEKQAATLLRKVKFIVNNIPPWMRPEIYPNNAMTYGSVHRDKRGDIISQNVVSSLTSNPDSAVGEAARFIFIDEFAKIEHDEGLWRSILPTITGGGQWMGASTPDGIGNTFYKLVMKAQEPDFADEDGSVPYHVINVSREDYNIDEKEFKKMIASSTADDIAQEWGLTFLQSGRPVFNSVDLAACYRPLENNPDIAAKLEAYRKEVMRKNPDYYYCLGVDSAVGKSERATKEKDFNSITALTLNGIQAFAHSDKSTLSSWAGQVVHAEDGKNIFIEGTVSKIHREYPGYMIVEENGPGETVVLQHESIENDSVVSEVHRHNTNAKSKNRLIRNLILAIESHLITITDKLTYEALLHYQHGAAPGTYEAPHGHHDDQVISLALAWSALLRQGELVTDELNRSTVSAQRKNDLGEILNRDGGMSVSPLLQQINEGSITRSVDKFGGFNHHIDMPNISLPPMPSFERNRL